MQQEQKDGLSRRDVLAAGGAAAIALGFGALPVNAQQSASTATGIVFESRDRSGRRQNGDPGLPGVLVSNGREVVETDAQGRYSLPVSDESIVFVIKPSGFMTPVDPVTKLPRFHYIHQPAGSPSNLELTFPGIAPTGPLPASIDFPLMRQEEPKAFEVVLFTDPQPESDAEVDFIREDVVDALAGTKAKFGLTMGDIMFDDLALYERYNRIVGTIGLPWYNIPGNHDFNFEAPGRKYSRETFKRVYGPHTYAFAYADAVFLMLDDVEYKGADPKKPTSGGGYIGKLDEDQLAFIKNLLAKVPDDKLLVIGLHIPLRNYLDPKGDDVNLTNRAELFALLKGRRFTVSFSGHTHTTEHHYFSEADGWSAPEPHHHHVLTAVSGSWWSGPYDHRGVAVADSRDGSPNGFHMLSIDGNRYTTRFVPAKEPNQRQLRISIDSHFHRAQKEVKRDFRPGQLLSSPIMREAAAATTLIANIFDGGPRTKAAMTIGSGEPIPMQRKVMPDPFVEDVFQRNEPVKKPWIKAEPSSHIWTAKLPANLAAGTHRVTVTAITEYGATISGSIALEVLG